MDSNIRVLYIEQDPLETGPISAKLAELDSNITLEVAPSPDAALKRLTISPSIHLLLADANPADPDGMDLLNRAKRRGIILPSALFIQSAEPGRLGQTVASTEFPDRILKRDGYLRELPYRLHSAYAHRQLRLQIADQKKVEERLHIHQIELEMQNEELKATQLKLDASRARYFDLYDLAPVGYCTVGQSGLIQEVNLTLTAQLGISRAALLNRPFVRFIQKDDSTLFNKFAKNPGKEGLSRKLELRMLKANGDPTWMLLDISLGHGEEGAPAFRIIVTDISHLKRTEEALRVSEAFNFAILNSMAPEIAVLDRNGVIVRMNESWRRFTSANGTKVPGSGENLGLATSFRQSARLRAEMMTDKCSSEAHAGIQAVLEGRLPVFNLEYPCQVSSRPQWFILNATPLGPISRGVVVSHTDITTHKLEEERLREFQKMLAIGTLAGGIAHDFNNVLTIILGNAELLGVRLGPDSDLQESIQSIQKAGTRAVYMVKQILAFSRSQPTERKSLDMRPIVEDTVRLLKATLPGRMGLDVLCDSDTPMVLADAIQIQQAILNVVTNATQAIKDGPGLIGIRLEPVLIDASLSGSNPELAALYARNQGRAVRLSITDNGPGMDSATLGRIFEPFFTTKPVNEGTGLGLSVVLGVVRNHEGAIQVESTTGGGSTFRIYFPESPENHKFGPLEKSEVGIAVPKPVNPFGKGRILFLDDEASIVSLFRIQLEQLGFQFTGFTNQDSAIGAVRNDPGAFDLVVSDYNMPGMSGVEVAREIRKLRDDLPVALASGYLDTGVLAAGGKAGIRDFLFKVTAVEEICVLMARLQEAQSYIPYPAE